jgi:sporulation protein YlmC with PRC-barrel domain
MAATPGIQGQNTLGLVLSGSTLKGDKVVNYKGEDLGKIEEIMIDLDRGRVAYAVLSFGGFMGMGDKLFAIPWQAITVDTIKKQLVLNADKELLQKAPGFDKNNWPDMADLSLGSTLYGYYGYKPYWA